MINYLKTHFEYKDGRLHRLRINGKEKTKTKTGTISLGYRRISIDRVLYLEHRLVFLLHYGYMPKTIDHINGNKLDNHIENLRECTQGQNLKNKIVRKDSKLGLKNISKAGNSYRVKVSGKYIGCFKDLELAELVAMEARYKYHGNFARH